MVVQGDFVKCLEAWPKVADVDINHTKFKILQHICEHPGKIASDIQDLKFLRRRNLHRKRKRSLKRKRDLEENLDQRTLRRYVYDLYRIGLIEGPENIQAAKKSIRFIGKPRRLSLLGVYYLILRSRIMPANIMKAILENYGETILFHQLIYPYINQNTLLNITDIRLISRVSLFLFECCRDIGDFLMSRRNGSAVEQVFLWQKVPSDVNETTRLRDFLKRELSIGYWIDQAEFNKVNNDNKLIISYGPNLISITLHVTKKNAILKEKGKELYKFMVERYHEGRLIIEAPTKSAQEFLVSSLSLAITQRIPSLVFDLTSYAEKGTCDFYSLAQDKTFMLTLKQAKEGLDNKYKEITKIAKI